MSVFYLPDSEGKRVPWLQNFSGKLPTYAVKYGITPAEVADVQAGAIAYPFWIDYANKQTEYSKKINLFKVGLAKGAIGTLTVPVAPAIGTAPALPQAGIFKRIATIVKNIKNNPVYTKNDGLDLGIEASPSAAIDASKLKPVISVRIVTDGHPEIAWTKSGHDGIEIQVDKGNNTWQFVGIDLKPNYTDTSALPATGTSELRRYRAIYIQDENHFGLWSDVVEIAVIGT
jgi:hypothetical protein